MPLFGYSYICPFSRFLFGILKSAEEMINTNSAGEQWAVR